MNIATKKQPYRLHPPENLLSLSENRVFHSFSPLNILRGELTAFA